MARTVRLAASVRLRTSDVRLENNPFFEGQLIEAVERELLARGIRRDEAAPRMRGHYHLSVEDHAEVSEANPSVRPANRGSGQAAEVQQYEQGTFIVHFVDAETGENLWIGWAQGGIGQALASSEKMHEWVDEAVALMFRRFPVAHIP